MTNISPQDYQSWLNQLKTDIRAAQQRSVLAVNQELIKNHKLVLTMLACALNTAGRGICPTR